MFNVDNGFNFLKISQIISSRNELPKKKIVKLGQCSGYPVSPTRTCCLEVQGVQGLLEEVEEGAGEEELGDSRTIES